MADSVTLEDARRNLVSHARMDGAWIGSIDISINKAFTSRAFDISTKDLAAPSQPGGQFYGIHVSNGGRIRIFAGGVPLVGDGGGVVGAVGVSGGSGEQDQEVAEARAGAVRPPAHSGALSPPSIQSSFLRTTSSRSSEKFAPRKWPPGIRVGPFRLEINGHLGDAPIPLWRRY